MVRTRARDAISLSPAFALQSHLPFKPAARASQVVPTTFEALSGEVLQTNQYTYTELFRTTHEVEKMPGAPHAISRLLHASAGWRVALPLHASPCCMHACVRTCSPLHSSARHTFSFA
eukprot:3922338-Pleurochrysis_carterae.AAC.1